MKEAFEKAARRSREKFQKLIYETPAEVYIGAALIGALSGGIAYDINSDREKVIPVAFSERGKTAKEFREQGKPVPPLTDFYQTANDIPMKVFESSNTAYEMNGKNSTFAGELETRMDRAL